MSQQPPWGRGPVIDVGGRGFRFPAAPKLPFGAWKGLLAALVGGVLLFTTYYQVEPEEVGVVQRFGAYVRTSDPGPHLKLPFGIETVTKEQGISVELYRRDAVWPSIAVKKLVGENVTVTRYSCSLASHSIGLRTNTKGFIDTTSLVATTLIRCPAIRPMS